MNVEAVTQTTIRGSPEAEAPTRDPAREAQHQQRVAETRAETDPRAVDPEQLAQALEGVNGFLATDGSHIQFAMHEGAGQMMVEVIDDRTNEVIKTIPSKELLDLASKIGELVGTLLDERG